MKTLLLSAVFSLLFLSIQCDKDDVKTGIPECLQKKITQLEKEDCPSVGRVLRYQFQGDKVYVIHPKNCGADFTSEVVDKNCNTVCNLGGLIGNTSCKGVDFAKNATDETQVYP